MIVGGFAVASWQMALGFSLGLQLGYLLLLVGLIALIWWWRAGRVSDAAPADRRDDRRRPAADRGLARPRAPVPARARRAPRGQALAGHGRRGTRARCRCSSPHRRRASSGGAATSSVRDTLDAVPEQTLFPGLAILLLAIAGLGWKGYPRPLRAGLGLAALALALLSLGFQDHGIGRFLPYRAAVRGAAGLAGHPRARTPEHADDARARAACGGRRRARGRRAAHPARCARGDRLRGGAAARGRGRGVGVRANRGGEAVAGYPHPTVPHGARRARRAARAAAAAARRPARTTAATCSGRPTGSRAC